MLRDHDYTDFIGSDNGLIPAAELRQQTLPHYPGYKGWLIKQNSSKILLEFGILAPELINGTAWISERERERGPLPSGCQSHQEMKSTEGVQNLPPQNMFFWHKDYFRLIFKKQQTQGKL